MRPCRRHRASALRVRPEGRKVKAVSQPQRQLECKAKAVSLSQRQWKRKANTVSHRHAPDNVAHGLEFRAGDDVLVPQPDPVGPKYLPNLLANLS